MISEKLAREEVRACKKELKKAQKTQDWDEVLRHSHYLEFLDFVLNFDENA